MQKRIAAIHDLSCVGKCSLTVALPVISCFGIECAVLPTALLSGHFAALPQVSVLDLTERMGRIAADWADGGLEFDAIFSGYLGSPTQAGQVAEFVRRFRRPGTLFVADPAMADDGRLYRGFDQEQVKAMRLLCAQADVVLPNVTEACLMLGEHYCEQYDRNFAERLLHGMAALGAGQVVLTGVSLSPDRVGIGCLDENGPWFQDRPRTPGHFNGTGDLFASVLTAAMVSGTPLRRAAEQAMDFTSLVIARTAENPDHRPYGVDFEPCLPLLWKKAEKDKASAAEKNPGR